MSELLINILEKKILQIIKNFVFTINGAYKFGK